MNFSMKLDQLSRQSGGRLDSACEQVVARGICHDSRLVKDGDLFVCLSGKNHRGEDFISQAIDRGASAAMVPEDYDSERLPSVLPLIRVDDTTLALRRLALNRRAQFSGRCVGITGSAGKTTAKNFLSQLLRRLGKKVTSSHANQNTELGLWLTMAALPEHTEYLVIEMGARQPGDIESLCLDARPNVGWITTILPVHLATFFDLETVLSSKAELYDSLKGSAIAIVNADLPQAVDLLTHCGTVRRFLYSFSMDEQLSASLVRTDERGRRKNSSQLKPVVARAERCHERKGEFTVCIDSQEVKVGHSIPGEHNAHNLLGAFTTAYALDFPVTDIAEACAHLRLPERRLQHIELKRNNLLIDDTYNANPDALLKGVAHAIEQRSFLWVVVGALSELGAREERTLKKLALALKSYRIDRLICVGEQARRLASADSKGSVHFIENSACLEWLTRQNLRDTCIYFKASRSAGLDQLVDAWLDISPLSRVRTSGI